MINEAQTNENTKKPRLYFEREIATASRLEKSIYYARSILVLLKYLGGQYLMGEHREGTPSTTLHAPDFIDISCGSDYKAVCEERIDRHKVSYTFPEYPDFGLSIKTNIHCLNNNFYGFFLPDGYSNFKVTIGEFKRPSVLERLKRMPLKRTGEIRHTELEKRARDLFGRVLSSGEVTFSVPPNFKKMSHAKFQEHNLGMEYSIIAGIITQKYISELLKLE